MEPRERTEAIERDTLAPWATHSSATRGRARDEEADGLRTAFQRDRDRVLHTKSFRRLKHKTQVFLAPEGDHYRTRLTHTLEVAQVARTICRALRLNEDLVEAICLAHDLGHTPFGHVGEKVLSQCCPGGFAHNRQSLRIVDEIEALNLTWEVRDGILNHTWSMPEPATPEGMVARWSDRIAYVNHDVDDALRAGVLRPSELPSSVVAVLGHGYGRRLDTMVRAMVSASGPDRVTLPPDVAAAVLELREFLFEKVYLGPAREPADKVSRVLRALYTHFREHPAELPAAPGPGGIDRAVADYVSGMTDRFALRTYDKLFVPRLDPVP